MRLANGLVVVIFSLILLNPQKAQAEATEPSVPRYELNRADEDYSYLRDEARRIDFWDPVKYLPLDSAGNSYLSLGGEARERYEYFNHPNWGQGLQDNGYFLQRYFLHGDLRLGRVRIFGQLQSSLENGRNGGPRPTDEDQLDLHQAFFDVKLGSGEQSLTLRSGRQELAFGSQRLISVREGPNVRQSFDGFHALYRIGEVQVDGFATRPARTKRYVFDDATDQDQALWGLYSVLPVPALAGGNADLYYLGLSRRQARFDQGTAHETRHSVGTRLWRTLQPLDYNFEFVYQWGSFGSGDIRAWTAASDTGYTIQSLPWRPRFGLRADIASGDRNRHDPDLQTFNPLFPKGAYFSENGLIGPSNFIDLNPSVQFHPWSVVGVTANCDFFWRESTHDGIYNNAVALVRSDSNSEARYIGSQPQLQLEWLIDRHTTLVAIYAHFFAGAFLKQSGPGADVDYLTTWLTYKF
jgi:hypothetical protein